jgi:DNA modification methylase
MSRATLYCGDALAVLKTLPAESVQCVVTSPPYWGHRDYGVPGQLGLEETPEGYVGNMVDVFAAVRRVLCADGTLWLNLGDSYSDARGGEQGRTGQMATRSVAAQRCRVRGETRAVTGLPGKNLIGIPWRVALALQADGWTLRSEIIWAKPNPMPESVTDRPTKAHEYVFLFAKRARYFYDAPAIAEPCAPVTLADPRGNANGSRRERGYPGAPSNGGTRLGATVTRNARSVWEIATQPYPEAHFATFPEELARRCILVGSRPGDTVLDPFGGSGTVAQVATGNGRDSIYIDLNPKYLELARHRIGPMLCGVA